MAMVYGAACRLYLVWYCCVGCRVQSVGCRMLCRLCSLYCVLRRMLCGLCCVWPMVYGIACRLLCVWYCCVGCRVQYVVYSV
jgi:hypothetical protein